MESQLRSGYQSDLRALKPRETVGYACRLLTGFVKDNGDAMGRPVGVAVDKVGALVRGASQLSTSLNRRPAAKYRSDTD
jgi:hypothetical protein